MRVSYNKYGITLGSYTFSEIKDFVRYVEVNYRYDYREKKYRYFYLLLYGIDKKDDGSYNIRDDRVLGRELHVL